MSSIHKTYCSVALFAICFIITSMNFLAACLLWPHCCLIPITFTVIALTVKTGKDSPTVILSSLDLNPQEVSAEAPLEANLIMF